RVNVRELAQDATVPVINSLEDKEHPCQVVADLFTIHERRGRLKGLRLSYIGDGNNVCNSLLLGTAIVGMHMAVACPSGYEPDPELHAVARRLSKETGYSLDIMPDHE